MNKATGEEKPEGDNKREIGNSKDLVALVTGSLSSVGLAISGMTKRYKIYNFLDVKGFSGGTWDGTLLYVMGGGLVISAAGYQFVKGYSYFNNAKLFSCPLSQDQTGGTFNIPTKKKIDAPLVLG